MNSKDCLQAIGYGCATAIVCMMLYTDGTEAAVAAAAVASACAGVAAYVGKKKEA